MRWGPRAEAALDVGGFLVQGPGGRTQEEAAESKLLPWFLKLRAARPSVFLSSCVSGGRGPLPWGSRMGKSVSGSLECWSSFSAI